jgi:hypothetical protein
VITRSYDTVFGMEHLMSQAEISRALNLPVSKVRRLRKAGVIAPVAAIAGGRVLLFNRNAVEVALLGEVSR